MTAHASDARTQKRSSLKGNRDTRRARLPRQQPPGRHGIVSPNRNQKEPAMPASKPVPKPSARVRQHEQQLKAARPAARKSRPRHGTSSRVRIAHIMGDERTTRRPRARERRLLRVLIIHGRNRKNPNHKAEHHEPTGQMLDRLAIARNGDRHPRRKASDHPARHNPDRRSRGDPILAG